MSFNWNEEKNQLLKAERVDIEGYAICVLFVEEVNGDFFLKTLFPSRKHTIAIQFGETK